MYDVQIIQAFVPADHPIRSHLAMAPKYITIHETANPNVGATDEMHRKYLLTQEAIDRQVLWHATVDSDSVSQHLPWDEVGWHAGDGYWGPGNQTSIGVELCVNADGDFEATKRRAAVLVAFLVRSVPSLLPFPECAVQHNKWSGKNCPAQIRATPGGWEDFLAMCKEHLQPAAWDPVAEIDRAIQAGLINTKHDPGEPVTWGQFATVLNRIAARKN